MVKQTKANELANRLQQRGGYVNVEAAKELRRLEKREQTLEDDIKEMHILLEKYQKEEEQPL